MKPARANKELVRHALRHAGIFDVAFSTSIKPLIPWIKLTKRMGLANLPRTKRDVHKQRFSSSYKSLL